MMQIVKNTEGDSEKKPLSEVDKDRLDKVLAVLAMHPLRFPATEVVKRTKFKKGHVSNILNGTIPMSENFFDTFMKHFSPNESGGGPAANTPNTENQQEKIYMETISDLSKIGVNLSETNKDLSAAQKDTALANRVLAENQRELIGFLKQSTNSQNSNQIAFSLGVRQLFDKMAIAGTQLPGLWKSQEEGIVILDKLLASGVMEMQSSDTRQPQGKQNK